jgi:hypothetical protein
MGLIRNFGGLIAMRLLLGAFEAGLFPGNDDTHYLQVIIH